MWQICNGCNVKSSFAGISRKGTAPGGRSPMHVKMWGLIASKARLKINSPQSGSAKYLPYKGWKGGGSLYAEYPQIAIADYCTFSSGTCKMTSRSGILLYYSDISVTKEHEALALWNRRGQDVVYRPFSLSSWCFWRMNMPFWGKVIACSATESKVALFCELQFPEVHCSSKAVITM